MSPTSTALNRPAPRHFLSNLVRIHVSGEETDGRLGVVEAVGGPGDMPPLHVHREQDEAFHVLEGELTLFVAGQEPVRLGPGESVLAPHGVPHVYEVTSDEPARWLALSTPAGFEAFVAELSEPADTDELPSDVSIDPEHVAATAARHGIDLLGPPGTRP
jgi:quercetin dioxygenase-like cupin family protein